MIETRYTNPSDRNGLMVGYIVAAASIMMGIIPLFLTPPVFLPLFAMLIFSALYIWLGYRKHVFTRPVSVTIRDDGLVLEFRSGKVRFLQWSDIKDVFSKSDPKVTKSGRGIGDGAVRVKEQRTPYLITYEIASALTERYVMAVGRPPIIWDGQTWE
jgi:hypothetical protein